MFQEYQQWQIDRLGKFTASEIHKIMEKGRSGDYFGKGAMTYIRLKAAEILTLEPNNGGRINSNALEWGNAHEHEALQRFLQEANIPNEEVIYYGGANPKFFEYTSFSGGSPDGVTTDSIIEIKCPYNSSEHIEHILLSSSDDLRSYYPECYWQMIFNMICTGFRKGYFISYDPRFADDELQIKILEIWISSSDEDLIKERLKEAEKQLSLIVSIVIESIKNEN